jgi:hypothetical protein
LNKGVWSKCWLCKHYEKTTDNPTSGCPILAKNDYLMRHGRVDSYLHYPIRTALSIGMGEKWYIYTPRPVCEHEAVSGLWNQGVCTDREVKTNTPNTIIRNKKEKACVMMDVAIPTERNGT